jgi:hypothetical protein
MANGTPEPQSDRRLRVGGAGTGSPFQPSPLDVVLGHERRRRTRLVRIVTIGIFIATVLLIPSTLIPSLDQASLLALSAALLGSAAAYLLNRFGAVSQAGFTLVVGVAAAVALDILAKATSQHGVDLNDLRIYDLFLVPIVLSGALAGRRNTLILAGGTILFTIVTLILLPKTPTLQAYWDGDYKYVLGSAYDVVAIAALAQALAAGAAWLGADSVRRALLDASRAEELSDANERVTLQASQIETQQRRLREGIAQIQQVHAAVARGHWDARARVEEGELIPLAISLNLLLDRLTRLTRDQEDRQRMETASKELALALRRARAGEPYMPPAYTGTPFDEVLVELSSLRGPRSSTNEMR